MCRNDSYNLEDCISRYAKWPAFLPRPLKRPALPFPFLHHSLVGFVGAASAAPSLEEEISCSCMDIKASNSATSARSRLRSLWALRRTGSRPPLARLQSIVASDGLPAISFPQQRSSRLRYRAIIASASGRRMKRTTWAFSWASHGEQSGIFSQRPIAQGRVVQVCWARRLVQCRQIGILAHFLQADRREAALHILFHNFIS